MTQTQIIATSAVTTLATLVLLALVGWGLASRAVSAHPGFGGPGAGDFHGRGAGPCARLGADKLRGVAGFVSGHLALTATQQGAFDTLTETLDQGRREAQALCESLGRPEDATRALANMEQFMSIGLSTLQTARPAFDGFYASLDADQQAKLDSWLTRPRHGRRGWRRGHGDDGRFGSFGDDAPSGN